MNSEYQKCVKTIEIEPGWKSEKHPKQPFVCVVKFSPCVHTYAPKYSELKEIIKNLLLLDGKEKVKQELGVVLNEPIWNNK